MCDADQTVVAVPAVFGAVRAVGGVLLGAQVAVGHPNDTISLNHEFPSEIARLTNAILPPSGTTSKIE